jgi:hypothetical protein
MSDVTRCDACCKVIDDDIAPNGEHLRMTAQLVTDEGKTEPVRVDYCPACVRSGDALRQFSYLGLVAYFGPPSHAENP